MFIFILSYLTDVCDIDQMILFINDKFKSAFIAHAVIICNYTCLFIMIVFSIIFYSFLLTACAYLITLIMTAVYFFYHLRLTLIYLNLKIF